MENEKIKAARRIEAEISNNLFLISLVVTLSTMTLMIVDFFSRGRFLPAKIGFFYISVVAVYSVHKELIRWLGEKRSKRRGEYFVYAWIILTVVLYAINFFSNDYFSYSKEGYPVSGLRDIAYLTIEVMIVFLLTRFFKLLFLTRKGP